MASHKFLTISLFVMSLLPTTILAQGNTSADAEFLDKMTRHHQSRIEMMKMADSKAHTSSVKKITKKMENEQSKDIVVMQKMRNKFFSSEEQSSEIPKKMDMTSLEQASGKKFDEQYLDMMAQHHQDGIKMIEEYKSKFTNSSVKKFAEKTEKNQKAEIDQFAKIQPEIKSHNR